MTSKSHIIDTSVVNHYNWRLQPVKELPRNEKGPSCTRFACSAFRKACVKALVLAGSCFFFFSFVWESNWEVTDRWRTLHLNMNVCKWVEYGTFNADSIGLRSHYHTDEVQWFLLQFVIGLGWRPVHVQCYFYFIAHLYSQDIIHPDSSNTLLSTFFMLPRHKTPKPSAYSGKSRFWNCMQEVVWSYAD